MKNIFRKMKVMMIVLLLLGNTMPVYAEESTENVFVISAENLSESREIETGTEYEIVFDQTDAAFELASENEEVLKIVSFDPEQKKAVIKAEASEETEVSLIISADGEETKIAFRLLPAVQEEPAEEEISEEVPAETEEEVITEAAEMTEETEPLREEQTDEENLIAPEEEVIPEPAEEETVEVRRKSRKKSPGHRRTKCSIPFM